MTRILTFGVFDYFHLGHLRIFKECKEHADYLIVAVQDGDYILKFKPQAHVLYTTEERKEILESLKCVDEVRVYQSLCPEYLETVDFDILALGYDHKGDRFDVASDWCKKHGKKVIRLSHIPGICSSYIKEEIKKL